MADVKAEANTGKVQRHTRYALLLMTPLPLIADCAGPVPYSRARFGGRLTEIPLVPRRDRRGRRVEEASD